MEENKCLFKKNIVLGVSLVLAALVLGIFMVCTIKTLKSYDDTVTVRGLCEKEVPADRVVLRISYSAQDKYTSARINDRYDSYYTSNITYRYGASQTISVFTSKMDLVGKLQKTIDADLLKKDIISSSYASYEYHGLNEIKPSMIAESLKNARSAADEFAKNSGSEIGKMRTASQGYFEVDDLDENTPQIKKVRVVSTVEYYLK